MDKNRRSVTRPVPLCLYGKDSFDSFLAAWVVWHYYKGDVECVPVVANVPYSVDVLGRDVIILGQLYQPQMLEELAERSVRVIWIHSSTTSSTLTALTPIEHNVTSFKGNMVLPLVTWEYYYTLEPYPPILNVMHLRDFGAFDSIAKGL